jgi:beta-phosphoglucomutase
MNNVKAFLFDMNGTMIDDMQYHIIAWHKILNNLGVKITLKQMKDECYGKNDELLERMLPGKFTPDEKAKMSYEKEFKYQQAYKPLLQLLPGLSEFLFAAKKKNIPMAIGTAAIKFNVDFVLDGLNIGAYFNAIVSAEDIKISKPNPETFIKCAQNLHVHPSTCIVFEDSPKGIESAAKAGMKAVAITTMHTAEEFSQFKNVIMVIKDYTDKKLQTFFN